MALRLRPLTFYTADSSKTVYKDAANTDWGYLTYTMKDSNGDTTTDGAQAVKTIVDVEFYHPEGATNFMDLRGGTLKLPDDIVGAAGEAWFLSAIGVPDVPAAYGGSIPFIGKLCLEALGSNSFKVETDPPITLKYDATNHTSKIRFTIWHPQGVSKRFQILMEVYR